MRFVKGYRILSTRRLAPLDKRIAKIDFKSLPTSSPLIPRESKSIVFNKTSGGTRPSVLNTSLMRTEESTTITLQSGVLLRSDSFDDGNKSPGTSSPILDKKELTGKKENDREGYASDPELLVDDEPGREGERDDYDFRARAPTNTSGNGLDASARIIDRTENGRDSPAPGDEPGYKDTSTS